MQRIILVNGPNIMRDMMTGAIQKDNGIEIVGSFALMSEVESFLLDGGTLDTDWVIILHAGDEALRLMEHMLEGKHTFGVMNVASDGSKVSIYDGTRKKLRELMWEDLLRVLSAGEGAFKKNIPGVNEEFIE